MPYYPLNRIFDTTRFRTAFKQTSADIRRKCHKFIYLHILISSHNMQTTPKLIYPLPN